VESICEMNAPSKTGAIEFRIGAWSSLPSEHWTEVRMQGRTNSETMQAAGDKWQISVRPGGFSGSSDTEEVVRRRKEYVAIFLHYEGDSEALRAKYSITLVNQLPGKADSVHNATVVTFGWVSSDTADRANGLPEIFKRSTLEDESQGWKVNDRVIIRVTITTFGDLESTVAAPTPAFTPPNTLSTDLKLFLTSGRASDIALYCGHRKFPAHRSILRARSPYFEGLFASTMRDADADGLPINDTQPDVFEQLLSWIYTGEVAEAALQAKDMLEHLLMAANGYECGGLKLLCEAKLCEGLTVENVATRLVLAEQAEADGLKEACLEFIKPNAAAVMGTEGWKDVMAAGAGLVSEAMAVLAGVPNAGKGKKRTAGEAGLSAQDAEVEEMRGWKVPRLREALQGRGLATGGLKAELVERLEGAIRGTTASGAGAGGSSGGSSSGVTA